MTVEVRYHTRQLQVFDTGFMSEEMNSAVEYIKRVTGMTPGEAKAFGWHLISSYQSCVSCGKPVASIEDYISKVCRSS